MEAHAQHGKEGRAGKSKPDRLVRCSRGGRKISCEDDEEKVKRCEEPSRNHCSRIVYNPGKGS
jgi:hypothetical protein